MLLRVSANSRDVVNIVGSREAGLLHFSTSHCSLMSHYDVLKFEPNDLFHALIEEAGLKVT